MTTLRERIEKRYKDSLATKCEKDKCTLKIDAKARHSCTVIDCDKCTASEFPGKRCDYLLFYWGIKPKVCILEFEGTSINKVSEWIEQLEAGLSLLERITTPNEVPYCRPVVLHRKGVNAITIKAIQNRRVIFRGERLLILLKKCGATLSDIIPKNT